MFERPQTGERAVLVHVDFPNHKDDEAVDEFAELVESAGAEPVATITASRDKPEPKYFVGTGKADEILQTVKESGAEVVLINHTLSPAQERNLERLVKCRVLDRTGLILDIFAQRARSHEGKLQVELAQLKHMSTRLVRGWTHLERQKGGIGLRGPGETQLETDRRLLGDRIKQIKKRLEKVRKQRQQSRRSRTRAEVPTVSLVGYTNAGKSTVFNRLTEAKVYAANQMFATLDPTLRRITLPNNRDMVLADTVGFIKNLPHDLVEAFHATLQESQEATLLIHVIDAHSPEREQNIYEVESVLKMIEADEVPELRVYNKIDLMQNSEPRIVRNEAGLPTEVWCSALTGVGFELLQQAMAERLVESVVRHWFRLPPSQGKIRARLYSDYNVLEERVTEQGEWLIHMEAPSPRYDALKKDPQLSGFIIEDSEVDALLGS